MTFSLLDSSGDNEQFCEDLKFFAKLVYVLTGDCTISRESVIEFCAPISQISGYISIVCWLFAQLPQVIRNHERKSVEGVSLGFLLCWFAGDFLNFTSCIMTGAMAFQILLSGYYCIIDIILGSQYYYYTYLWSKHAALRAKRNQRLKNIRSPNSLLRHRLKQINNPTFEEIDNDDSGLPDIPTQHISIPNRPQTSLTENGDSNLGIGSSTSKSVSFSKMITSSFIMGFSKVDGAPISPDFPNSTLALNTASLGKILAWSCTTLYLSSRTPQLITNYRQKSTRGISILLFLSALSGNTFYSLSLATSREALTGGEVTQEFWSHQLSYLLGAALTVGFDLIMLYQWYSWDYKKPRRTPRSRSGRITSPLQVVPVSSNPISLNDPIVPTKSPIVILSPNHARKLSELTPLSPQDFLIDSYLGHNGQRSSNDSNNPPTAHKRFASRVTDNYGSF